MPLVGIVDPSHDEYSSHEPGRKPAWLTKTELLDQALMADPKWSPWSYEIISAMLEEWQDRSTTHVSSSLLVSACPRSAVLERVEPFIIPLERMWATFRGTMIHRTLEYEARPDGIAEGWFSTTLPSGLVVSCSPDLVTPNSLWDYKFTENPPTFGYPWKSHTKQVQFNRYIVNHAEDWKLRTEDAPAEGTAYSNSPMGIDPHSWQCEHLVLAYLGPKGPKLIECMSSQEVTTPNGKTIKRKMPDVWSDEKVLELLEPAAQAYALAFASYPDFPEELAELWGGPPGWQCPGKPWCMLPDCLAKSYPNGMFWEN